MVQTKESSSGAYGNFYPYRYLFFRNCPFCRCSGFRRKGRQGTGNHFHPQVVQCVECGLLFVNPIADRESMELYYADYGSDHPRETEISEKIRANVAAVSREIPGPEPRRYLDIGAASGELVQAFEEAGWEAYGVEISDSYVRFARERRNLHNIEHAVIEDMDYPENFFDYITFWHVIEHLREPIQVLQNAYKWLKPGGMMHMGMPNPTPPLGVILSMANGRFSLGQDHTFGFPKHTTDSILKRIGFEIIQHRVYSNPKPATNFKNRVHNMLHRVAPILVANFQIARVRKPLGIGP